MISAGGWSGALEQASARWLDENPAQGVIVCDERGLVQSWNGWMAARSGRPAHTVCGQRLTDAFPELVERRLAHYWDEALAGQVRLLSHRLHGYLLRFPDSTGRYECMQQAAQISPLVHDGRVVGTITTITDVTERVAREAELLRAGERRYRRIVDNASEGIWMLDAGANTTFLNPRMARMLGCAIEDAIGKPMFAFIEPSAHDEVRARLLRRESGSAIRSEVPLKRLDGSELWVEIHTDHLLDAHGAFESSLAFVTDISQRRRAEAALKRADEQLRQAQKMEAVGNLAGGIAHDFNNLLSIVLSYSQLMLADLAPADPLRDGLSQILKAGERATALTRHLLAFSRKQVLQPTVVDVAQVIGTLATMLGRVLGETISLSTVFERNAGNVRVDQAQLEQVILNLVVNARDAMPLGGQVHIETTRAVVGEGSEAHSGVAPGDYVMIAVTDNGVGMDGATQDRIFEPFFTTKDKSKGTGLGLSTVYGIVKQSGGYVTVRSEPGKGSTLAVYLPRNTMTDAPAEPAPAGARSTGGTETVLLVEDEPEVRRILHRVLRKHGYRVLEAENGGDAILLCEKLEGEIDLLLTDVVMPRMSGRQLAERLLRQRPAMKVLYVSGYSGDALMLDEKTGTDFLPKPIQMEPLLKKLRAMLDRGR